MESESILFVGNSVFHSGFLACSLLPNPIREEIVTLIGYKGKH